MPLSLTDELAQFVEGGISVLVGTRDAAMRPAALRGGAVRVSADRKQLHVMLPAATSARTIANLRDNGRIAVTCSRPSTFRSIQLKGRCVDIHDTPASDRAWLEKYLGEFSADLELVGLPAGVTGRVTVWPAITVTMTIESMFDQAPGPEAGRPYEAPSR